MPALEVVREETGEWNRRFVLRLDDASLVEAVLYRGDTLCVSSQVGCAVRCPFCASGASGLGRSLRLDELIGQVEAITQNDDLTRIGVRSSIRGITLSGIGEPLHNHEVAGQFFEWARARSLRVTLTTSGGPLPRLREWMQRPHHGLTVSVHAGTEAVRARAVPQGPPLEALFAVLGDELPRLTRTRRKRTALAYLLVGEMNDDDAEIDAFIDRARPLGIFVHLYGYNEVPTSALRAVPRARYEEVYARMTAAGLTVRMSARARLEANGGCGTLVALKTTKPGKTGTMPGEERCPPRSTSPGR